MTVGMNGAAELLQVMARTLTLAIRVMGDAESP
jgi:hypothetical protein